MIINWLISNYSFAIKASIASRQLFLTKATEKMNFLLVSKVFGNFLLTLARLTFNLINRQFILLRIEGIPDDFKLLLAWNNYTIQGSKLKKLSCMHAVISELYTEPID